MDKVYLVEASFGSWHSHGTQIVKVFENEDDAKIYSEKYDKVIRKVSDFHHSAWMVVAETDYDDFSDDDFQNDFHHSIWSKYNYRFGEFNETKIIEMSFVEHKRKTNLKNLLD